MISHLRTQICSCFNQKVQNNCLGLIFWSSIPLSCRWFIRSVLRNFLFTLNVSVYDSQQLGFVFSCDSIHTRWVNGLFGNVYTTKMYFSRVRSTTNNLFKSTWIFYEDLWWNVLSLDIIELIFSSKYLSILPLLLPSS